MARVYHNKFKFKEVSLSSKIRCVEISAESIWSFENSTITINTVYGAHQLKYLNEYMYKAVAEAIVVIFISSFNRQSEAVSTKYKCISL
jgi:hypothetical protein